MNLPPTLRKLAGGGVTFSRALLKDGNLLSRPQPEAVLAPVSYRSSRRRRQRKRLLLKVANDELFAKVVKWKFYKHIDNNWMIARLRCYSYLWRCFLAAMLDLPSIS